ncbi:MAG: PaaI family thioesterase [Proteobacteria bacterium]|nr:PaaI family thioesterase [Pseudomonadota bacterium]MBU1451005.1 PaaI family thioesterase [Pseudomonadota bacterium]MBU2468565.1 PaaI family thioesterase [Pseudomonadota bacterium]MBU2516449.1 PaaI family thioesterase [Pseudomonadota bacterium]
MLDPTREASILRRVASIPIVDTLGMEVLELATGLCRIKVARKPAYDGVFESFHGGLLMTVADSAACFAILTVTGAEARLTTTDMNIRFLAPCLSDLTVAARIIKVGRTMCPVSVELFDGAGVLVAVAQVNYILLA